MFAFHIILIIVFWVFSILDIVSVYRKGRRIWKPLLMPVMILILITGCVARAVPIPWLAVAALFCGFLGDTLLLKDTLFAFGLVAFLVGHIFYILEYAREIQTLALHPAAIVLFLALLAVFLILILRRLFPSIQGPIKAGAAVYMIGILSMLFIAFLRYGNVPPVSFAIVLVGASLFVISDTILAFSTFTGTSGTGIMETYCAAQFLIAEGILLAQTV